MFFELLIMFQTDIFDKTVNRLGELVLQTFVQRVSRVENLHTMNWLGEGGLDRRGKSVQIISHFRGAKSRIL